MAKLPGFPQQGGCVCGAVRYELTAPPLGVYRCHCKDCQRFSSAGFGLSMVLKAEHFRVIRGEAVVYGKPADSGRTVPQHACPQCGTKLWNRPVLSPELIILKPGTLDDANWIRPVGNIWTVSALEWVDVDPDEPEFSRQPPSREPLYEAWSAQFDEV